MAENDVSDGSDFEDKNDTVLDSIGPGEAEDPIDRVVGCDMLVNVMFDDDLSGFDAAWVENSANFRLVHEPVFRLIPGSQVQHPPEARVIEYFDFYFNDIMWERIVEKTNHYPEQQHAANPPLATAPR